MTYQQIIQDIKKKIYHPVYFLEGEETYFIDKIAKAIEDNVLDDVQKEFNLHIFYGKDTDALTILDAAQRYPMMAPCQIVIVREAQYLRDLKPFESYLNNPQKTTILVICHKNKTLDQRKKVAKLFKQKAVFFSMKPLRENQVPDWVKQYLDAKGFTIEQKALMLITEHLGTNISKIANELEKLILNISRDEVISASHIQKYIGINKDYNTFELQDAISSGDHTKAAQIINYFIQNIKPGDFMMLSGALFRFFSQLYVYHKIRHSISDRREMARMMGVPEWTLFKYQRAGKIFDDHQTKKNLHLLMEYDGRAKGVGNKSTNLAALLKELNYKMTHQMIRV